MTPPAAGDSSASQKGPGGEAASEGATAAKQAGE